MFIKPIYSMKLRQLIKAVRWYAFAPLRRRSYLRAAHYRRAATGMHWSTELSSSGSFSCTESVTIGRRTRMNVSTEGVLVLRNGVWIGDDCEIGATKSIQIGSHTSLQNRSIILGEVSMGAGCACGPNLYISSSWHHFEDIPAEPIRWQDAKVMTGETLAPTSRAVEVGDDCWIGINVVIAPGVRIGRGCIIGANSVVTKDLPPYSVAAGVPARVIRERLNFAPPGSLSADLSEHIPYFYSGFAQWGAGVSNLSQALDGGGWRAEEKFKLAISVERGVWISLRVRAPEPGKIRHGSELIGVPAGESTVRFVADPSDAGFLGFEWLSSQPGNGSAIVVFEVDQDQ